MNDLHDLQQCAAERLNNREPAEHLGAIQVLGFALGAVIGAFQLLI